MICIIVCFKTKYYKIDLYGRIWDKESYIFKYGGGDVKKDV